MLDRLNTLLKTHHYELEPKILSLIPVDLQQLIAEVVTELEPLATAKSIELQHNIANEIPNIKGDRLELCRVMTNLISNAIKFTDTGSVRVSLSQNDSEVLVQVEDSGIGISPQEQQTIFQRFIILNHEMSKAYT